MYTKRDIELLKSIDKKESNDEELNTEELLFCLKYGLCK